MFYRLKEGYALRGWERMSCVLTYVKEREPLPLNPTGFRLLLLCDGRTDFDASILSEDERKTLEFFLEKKIVSASETLDPIAPEQEYRVYPNRYVRSAFWSVTGRCNYHCRHCYMDAPDAALGELSHKEAMDVIEQMAQCGVMQVDITGGEPFVRSDFWELVDAMLAHGMKIGMVYTNGWLVDEALLAKFEERGMRPEFSVSFDGVGWHDWMRGVKGAEEAALRCLRLCVEHGFPTDVEMCLHKGNVHTLRETVKVLSGIGVPRMKVSPVSDTELWKKNCEGNQYGRREYCKDMLAYIPQFFEDGCPMSVHLGGIIQLWKGSKKFRVDAERYSGTEDCGNCHLCGSVRWHVYITPDGRLLPCMPMTACKEQELFPKLSEVGMREGLSDGFFMKFADSRISDLMKANEKCRNCQYVLKCGGGCRAMGLQATGDLMGADENLCMLWNEGYVDRIRQAVEDAIRRFPPKETENEPTAG